MDGGISQLFRDLCKIQTVRPYHFLSGIDLHQRKIFDDPKPAVVLEDLLQLGPADQVVLADLFNGDGRVDADCQIIRNPVKYLGIALALG